MPKRQKIPRDKLQGWTIVVVDDEDDSLDVARRILTHFGATVHTGGDGVQGLTLVQEHLPDLIISDLSMPNLDGWGLIYELKEKEQTQDIPIIALTAHAMQGDRERALGAGFDNYLTKPLSPATFMPELLSILGDIPTLAAKLDGGAPPSHAATSPAKPNGAQPTKTPQTDSDKVDAPQEEK